MKILDTKVRSVTLAVLIAGAAVSNAVIAAEKLEEVTVEATRMTKQVTPGAHPGAPIESATLSLKVGYADLDLSTANGSKELGNRVGNAAKEICDELDRLFKSSDPSCLKNVTDGGMKQADKAIKAHTTAK